jgi:hypothetical protein
MAIAMAAKVIPSAMASTSASNGSVKSVSLSSNQARSERPPIMQLYPWRSEEAFLLEEIEMPQALALGVVEAIARP